MNPQHEDPPPWSRAADKPRKGRDHQDNRPPNGSPNEPPDDLEKLPGGGPKWGRIAALFAVVGGIMLIASWLYPGELTGSQAMGLVYILIVLAVLGGSWTLWSRVSLSRAVKYGAIWAGIFVVAILIGSFWEDMGLGGRFSRSLMPGVATTGQDGEIIISRRSDGHFYLFADVNGSRTLFLVDTGATSVALTREDARRAGLDVAPADFIMTVQTANGEAKAAPVKIDEITVDGLVVRGVRGHVGSGGMGESLLGMSYLERFSSYEVRGSQMYLRP